ncbi:unnamed protein product [Mytilus edulis]|uniref:Uncharacterized protein n=1 Tax=Mytilus edulis TaxID=6550 RepID=A0A8S3RAJ1_MYTED|nr:unnamed protein product [Mytilus edulis]
MRSTGDDLYKNELAELFTLTQIIEVETENLSESETKEVESHIHGYIQNALNDNLSKDGDEQIPFYDARVQHWESMHMYFMMKRKDTVSTIKHICFVILSVLLFPILSVAVAWFSWPHLIGTENSGKGRTVRKPYYQHFPTNHKDISNKLPAHVKAMKKTGIISQDASDGEILASIATLKLASIYLRRGVKESNVKKRKTNQTDDVEMNSSNLTPRVNDESNHLDVLLATRKGFIGKCNKSK